MLAIGNQVFGISEYSHLITLPTFPVKVIVPVFEPEHTTESELMVPATVPVLIVAMVSFEQPLVLVYVMVVVPTETLVINPVLLMVATPPLDDNHGLAAAAVAEPVSCDVWPLHNAKVPVMVGNGFTVTIALPVMLIEQVVVVLVA